MEKYQKPYLELIALDENDAVLTSGHLGCCTGQTHPAETPELP